MRIVDHPARRATLCWDCAKACGGCRWSKKLKPVPGWTAEHFEAVLYSNGYIKRDTYIVTACPEFERDALKGGEIRLSSLIAEAAT